MFILWASLMVTTKTSEKRPMWINSACDFYTLLSDKLLTGAVGNYNAHYVAYPVVILNCLEDLLFLLLLLLLLVVVVVGRSSSSLNLFIYFIYHFGLSGCGLGQCGFNVCWGN